jgi:hypothetical protein
VAGIARLTCAPLAARRHGAGTVPEIGARMPEPVKAIAYLRTCWSGTRLARRGPIASRQHSSCVITRQEHIMSIRQMIVSLFVSGLLVSATAMNASASPTAPFKTLRVVVEPDGTLFVGGNRVSPGQGFTVTHLSTGHYRATFPPGTWSSCFFLPQVQTIFTTATAQVTGYTTSGDGSGGIDVAVSTGADAWLVMVFTSAEC